MCEVCDAQAAGASWSEAFDIYAEKTRVGIDVHGHTVTGIPDGDPVPFAYTTGLTEQGRPELFMAGLSIPVMATVINDAAKIQFEAGDILPDLISNGYQLAVIKIDPAVAQMYATLAYYRNTAHVVTALQLVWPDIDGRWPWEADYSSGFPQPTYQTL